jgi:hypothetical protein
MPANAGLSGRRPQLRRLAEALSRAGLLGFRASRTLCGKPLMWLPGMDSVHESKSEFDRS